MKRFLVLWTGQFISAIGGGLTSFGLLVYVFQKTGSAAGMALVTLLGFLPTLLLSVPAGALADRYDRRLMMMIGDGCSGLGILFILINMMNGDVTLTTICIGVFISAAFSSLLEPAYKATVSDLLTEEEYSKASGLISLAGSARYLISPVIAGIILSFANVSVLLVIDICTFILTVISTFVVRKGIAKKNTEKEESIIVSIKEGFTSLKNNRGVFLLVVVASVLTLFIGAFQILAEPLVLSIADAKTLGITETICASGMLVSSLYLGIRGIKKGYVKVLCLSLSFAGVFIFGFGQFERIPLIIASGFAFFLMLPFANNCLDYLVRVNTPVEIQGRVWGIVGFLSQIGYVISYGISGLLADNIAKMKGISVGRGAGSVMKIAGVMLIIVSIVSYFIKDIKQLEETND